MIPRRTLQYAVLLASFALTQGSVRAASQDSDYYDDPPDRIARMNYAQGSVSFQPGDNDEWVSASPNRPLTVGDQLWVDRGSRAELHVGSTALRLDSETSLSFLDLSDRAIQLRLSQGSLLLQVAQMDQDDVFEVDTPNTSFTVLQSGEYRIDVNPDGNETIATVWRGRGEAVGGGYSFTVSSGQQARFSGMDQWNYQVVALPASDDFDNWAFDRDRRQQRVEAIRYVSPEVTGYEDLDQYGRWDNVAQYGPVWIPSSVPSGWAPYSSGHWVWIRPWGWTWVDDQPWGFAPFHYGRWALVSNRWGWIPGPIQQRPVYAPALVAFVGGPQGFQIGGGPAVAWFPLGPGEVFVPAYRVTPRYVTRVNVTNTVVQVTRVTTVYNYYTSNNRREIDTVTYLNRSAPNSVTVVTRDTFVNAQPVNRNVVRVSADQIARAPVEREVAMQPVKASLLGPNPAAKTRPPAVVADRQVIAKRMPPPTPARVLDQPADAQPPMGTAARPAQSRTSDSPTDARNRRESKNPLVKAAPAVREKNPQQIQEERKNVDNLRPQSVSPKDKPAPDSHPETTQPNPKQTPPQSLPPEPRNEMKPPEPKPVPQPNGSETPLPRPKTPQPEHRQSAPRGEVPQPEPGKELTPPEPRRDAPRSPEPGKETPTPKPGREATPPDQLRDTPRPEHGKEAPTSEPKDSKTPRPMPQKEPPQDEKPQPPNQTPDRAKEAPTPEPKDGKTPRPMPQKEPPQDEKPQPPNQK